LNILRIPFEELRDECTAILIPEFDYREKSRNYLETICEQIFEIELESWERDRSKVAKEKRLKTFQEWFDVEIHTVMMAGNNMNKYLPTLI